MRSKAIVILLALSTALAVWAATPAKNDKKKTAAKVAPAKGSTSKKASTSAKASTSKSAKSATGKKSTSAKSTSAKSKSSKQVAAASRYRRSTQREPAPERYKEIQQSLAEKGYFAGPVNGAWGTDSVAALKRFQHDQNIGDDGKLGSLSLIALGLGPKRGAGGTDPP